MASVKTKVCDKWSEIQRLSIFNYKLNHVLRSAERKFYADLLDKNKSNLKKDMVCPEKYC